MSDQALTRAARGWLGALAIGLAFWAAVALGIIWLI